jgi:hypothetical protein
MLVVGRQGRVVMTRSRTSSLDLPTNTLPFAHRLSKPPLIVKTTAYRPQRPARHASNGSCLNILGPAPARSTPLRAIADGQPAHRRSAHGALQPSARPQVEGQVDPPDRGHGSGALGPLC